MKIAHVAPVATTIPPPKSGSVETMTSLLTEGLVNSGHDVTLFASGDSLTKGTLSYIFETAPSELIGRSLPEIRHALACYERADEFDVINDHSGIPAAALGGAVQTPVLHTVHGPLDTHEAQHAIMDCLGETIWEAQRTGLPPDTDAYLQRIERRATRD